MSQNVCACPTAADRFVMPAHPQYPKLRAGTQLDAIYERLLRNGTCFRKPGLPQGLPRYLKMVYAGTSMSGKVSAGFTLRVDSPRGKRIGDYEANPNFA